MLVVLALLWAAFLFWVFRSRIQAGFGDSVGSFRRDLHFLERSAPATMAPANRLRSPRPAAVAPPGRTTSRPAAARPAPARQGVGGIAVQARRRQANRRRRDVLFLLLVVVLATLAMAGATRSHALIALQLLADVALGIYVALLVRLRNLAAERELKLRYLTGHTATPARRPEAGMAYADLALRRAASH